MPHLVSICGLLISIKYVSNWYSLVALYFGIISKTTARFRNGKRVDVSKSDYIPFREEIYRMHLEEKGFMYNGNILTNTKNGMQIILQPNCLNLIDEVFVRNSYDIQDLAGRAVIDIGAFVGDSSLYFITRGASKVYGFEINPEFYRLAQRNIDINNLSDKIRLYNEAACARTIETLVQKFSLTNIFMKIDCEGCENEILKNMSDEIFNHVTQIAMEYHTNPDPLIQRLRGLGFKVKRKKNIFTPNISEGILFAKRNYWL